MMPKFTAWRVLPAVFLLFSCSPTRDADAVRGEVPDTVSENFRQVSVSPEGRVEIESTLVETYGKSDLTVFTRARMTEIDSDGEKTLEGSADSIQISGDRNSIARGDVRVLDLSGDSRIEAEYLEWNDRKRTLTGTGVVKIETGDGFVVSGEGFIADIARDTYRFTSGVEGTLEIADEG